MTRSTLAMMLSLGCVLMLLPAIVQAQPRREGRLEIGGSVGVAGSHDLGTENATEPGNGVPSGSPLTLFQADTSLERAPLIEGRVAWHLTRALAVEGTFGVVRTHLRTTIKNDFEQAPPTTATSRLTQYIVAAGLLWQFTHGRVRPFVTGGGGYLRQLHDGATVVETGKSAFAGGGVKIALRESRGPRPSIVKMVGLRIDAQAVFTRGGFDVNGDVWRHYPTLTGGIFVCF
jgi:hypothetical protein